MPKKPATPKEASGSEAQYSDPKSPEFQRVWAQALARAATDREFLQHLCQKPAEVFQEYGLRIRSGFDLNKDVSPSLDEALQSSEKEKPTLENRLGRVRPQLASVWLRRRVLAPLVDRVERL